MPGIIVHGTLDGFPVPQPGQLIQKKLCLKGLRMVIIHLFSFVEGNAILFFIVIVMIKHSDIIVKCIL